MPKIEQPQPVEEEQEEEKTEEEEKQEIIKKARMFNPDVGDDSIKDTADTILNKVFSVESEGFAEEDNSFAATVENGEGLEFSSDGESQKVLTVFPSNNDVKYSLEIQSVDGTVISTIPNLIGRHKARITTMQGNFKLVVKSNEDNLKTILQIN